MIQIKVKDIQLWDANYRVGDVDMIVTSIQRFGYNRSVSLWRDNVVIAGNHTVKALQQLEAQQADTPTNVTLIDGDWAIDVTDVSHLSEDEAQAYAIADNRASDSATNDDEQLASLLTQLQGSSPELVEATGFDEKSVGDLLYRLNPTFDASAEWEGMPEFEQETIKTYQDIIVHLNTKEDVERFAELMEQNITDKTKYIYYPKQENLNLKAYQVINEP